MLPLVEAPSRVCILRLSAIGDTCHVVPILRTLQRAWPAAHFTWVIAKHEAQLLSLIDEVEFIIVDKRTRSGRRGLKPALDERRFDVLLHMQVALRASLIARQIRAGVKLGFDRARARELQWLFTNAKIAARERQHVLDSFFEFPAALGVTERILRWDLPLPPQARAYAQRLIPDGQRTLVISPCSSHQWRNWPAERFAAVARHAVIDQHMRVILAGGTSATEARMGAAIERLSHVPLLNQIGADTLPQLLALLERASVLLSPDSGPVHMATMVGTPVLGLYAATNPARSGPYLSRRWCVDRYAQAAERFRHSTPEALPWATKIEEPGVMNLIEVEQVIARLDELLASRP